MLHGKRTVNPVHKGYMVAVRTILKRQGVVAVYPVYAPDLAQVRLLNEIDIMRPCGRSLRYTDLH